MTQHDPLSDHHLLDAARRCFLRQSFDAVELRDIAWETSMSEAEIRTRFGSKDGLFAAIVDECARTAYRGEKGYEALAFVLRALADPATASLTEQRIRAGGLGSLGTHHLRLAAQMLDGASPPPRAAQP